MTAIARASSLEMRTILGITVLLESGGGDNFFDIRDTSLPSVVRLVKLNA